MGVAMPLEGDHWYRRAEHARVTAKWMADPDAKAILIEIALLYEQLARMPAAYSFSYPLLQNKERE